MKPVRYIRLFISVMILGIGLSACNSNQRREAAMEKLWSERMADAVMARFDSLVVYNNPDRIKWQYDIAMLGQAIDRLGSEDPAYSEYMQDFVDYFVQEDGTILKYKKSDYNLDHINPAKNLLTLYKRTGDQKYLAAIDQFIEQLVEQPCTSEGGFWHKKIYPHQMWLDGIYMSSPFMAQYAKEFNQPEWFDTVSLQIRLIYDKTFDLSSGLLYHAWDESREQRWADKQTGCSPCFWGRAMGWYMMALVDVLDYFPQQHPDREKLLDILVRTAAALRDVRDPETGLWYQVLDQGDREGNYLEASCSCMFTYAFAKGAKKGYLSQDFYRMAEESFDGIVGEFITVEEDGMPGMRQVCGGAGLGGDPYRDGSYEYYINEKRVMNDPKGVGPFILAALELKK